MQALTDEQGPGADRGPDARLTSITVGDDPASWAGAGFTVTGDEAVIGSVRILLVGDGERRGIRSWTLAGLDHPEGEGDLDGLPTTFVAGKDGGRGDAIALDGAAHPNGVVGLDHVVVSTPDLDRTIAAFEALGLPCRRIRDSKVGGTPVRQAFFRAGPTIIEVVGGAPRSGQPGTDPTREPAGWFGLAVDVDDLDETAALLGEGIGTPKGAVQRGRRIATLRHRTYDLSVAVAAMDHHGDR